MTFQLAVGTILLVAVLAWILSDWQLRNIRAVALLGLASAVGVGIGYLLNADWGFAVGALIGGLLAVPVLTHHPLVTSLKPADSAMVRQLGDIERRLVAASHEFRLGRADLQEYEQLVLAARQRVRAIKSPDKEWADVVRAVGLEIDQSLLATRGQSGDSAAEELRRRRVFIRNAYRDLIRRRSRIWT